MIIGANHDDDLGLQSGSAYVFERSFATMYIWTQTQKLLGSNLGQADHFGSSIGSFGDTAVLGCEPRDTAFVFQRIVGVWSEQAQLAPINGGPNPLFNAVAIDGNTIVVGARTDDELLLDAGAAYVFVGSGSTWNLQTKLVASDGASNDHFGKSVAIRGDRAVVGAIIQPTVGAGAAYVFDRTGSTWTQKTKLTRAGGASGAPPEFGRVVDVDDDTIIVGAPGDDAAGVDSGAAYVFLIPRAPLVYCAPKVNSLGCTPSLTHSGTPSATNPIPFTIGAQLVVSNKPGILIYGYCANDTPFQGGVLCVGAPIKREPGQYSGGNPPPSDCSGVFNFDFNSHIQSAQDPGLVAGATAYAQYWYRDPPGSFGIGLTDALVFTIEQ